jgi:hypothetical protein
MVPTIQVSARDPEEFQNGGFDAKPQVEVDPLNPASIPYAIRQSASPAGGQPSAPK